MYQGDEISRVAGPTLRDPMSRRTVLHRAAGLAIAVPAVGTLLAACGGVDDEESPSEEAAVPAGETETEETEGPAVETAEGDAPTAEGEEDDAATPDNGEEPAAADAGEEIIYRALGEFANLDQHHSGGNQDTIAILNVHSRLVYFERPDDESEQELLPDLAIAWEMADDATEVTFTLRENVTWHKGYGEFTASDVAFTLNRIRDPEVASRWRADWSHISEVIVEDDYSVRVVLEIPDPLILQTGFSRTGTILNQRAVEELGDEYSSNPIGTGPFIFESWSRGEQAVLVRNEGHWLFEGGDSNIERAIFRFVEDDQSALLAFEAGELDMGFIEQPEIQVAAVDTPNLSVDRRPHTRINRISFGTRDQNHIIHDVHFRRALSLSIDRDLIAEEAFEGMATPARTLFNPNHHGYLEEELYPFMFDPDAAQEELAQSAYDGSTISFLSSPEGATLIMALVLQSTWQELGINTELLTRDVATYREIRNQGDWDIESAAGARDFPEQDFIPNYTSAGIPGRNTFEYTGIDDLASEVRVELDFSRRLELLEQVQHRLAEDVPGIPILYPDQVFVWRDIVVPSFIPSASEVPLWKVRVDR